MPYYQVRWAKMHDWFIRVERNHGSNDYTVVVRGDVDEPEEIRFNNLSKLREWAGY